MLVSLWKKEALVHCWWECKYYYMIQESHFSVYIEVRWKENRISKRYLHALVHCSIIHNNQDGGTTLVFINGWTDIEDVRFIYKHMHTHIHIIQKQGNPATRGAAGSGFNHPSGWIYGRGGQVPQWLAADDIRPA